MTLAVHPVTMPSDLAGQQNGQLGPCSLKEIHLNGIGHASLHPLAVRAFSALLVGCLVGTGRTLTATSGVDCYRPIAVQISVFHVRYTPTYDQTVNTLQHQRTYQGRTWYLRHGMIPCAAPGTSNHGWGLAVDVAMWDARQQAIVNIHTAPAVWAWLLTNYLLFGFSHEDSQEGVDDPHIRYWAGDQLPAKVIEIEKYFAGVAAQQPH